MSQTDYNKKEKITPKKIIKKENGKILVLYHKNENPNIPKWVLLDEEEINEEDTNL